MAKSGKKRAANSNSRRRSDEGASALEQAALEQSQGEERPARITEDAFFVAVREIESAERKKDESVAKVREARKRAKERGLDLKMLDFVRRLNGFTQQELLTLANNIVLYAKYMRIPVFKQLDLFEEKEPSESENLQMARDRGLVAGRAGEDRSSNPWPIETPMGREFDRSWVEGNREIGAGIKRVA